VFWVDQHKHNLEGNMALDVKKNIGEMDKQVRYAVGGFIVLMALAWGSWLVGLLGLIILATAWYGWCPPYDLLGINSSQLTLKDIVDFDALSERTLTSKGWCGFLNGSNLGSDDRYWRYGFSGTALLFGYAFSSFLWFLIGFVLFATAISGRCPAYHIFAFNSHKKKVAVKSAAEISAEVFEAGEMEKVEVMPIEAKEADVATPLKAEKTADKPKPKKKVKKAEAESTSKVKTAKKIAPNLAKTKGKTSKKRGLTTIEGIGPKISEILQKNGVADFSALASADPLKIKEMLMAEGSRYAMHNPESWPEQAAMARDEKWDALEKWQDKYKGGRKK
jgi:predicted flap endonuclease-1-like 5' DNA nuclease